MTTGLREEIRQKAAFKSLEQEAYLNLIRTTAKLVDALEQVLKPAGLTGAQYNVLRILRGAEPTGLCRNEVRDRMVTRMPDMTRLLDRMEANGLVVRSRSEDDRRQVSTRITRQGQRALDQVEAAVYEEHTRQLGHMTRKDLKLLIDLLGAARQGGES
jgi:DNA-binding MarR family transcriptional regulator